MEMEMIKNINYNPSLPDNRQLADDWRIVTAWYATKRKGGDIKYSLETIVNLAKLIYDEIVSRVSQGKMKHEFKPDEMKPYARELYYIVSKGKVTSVNFVEMSDEDLIRYDEMLHAKNLYDTEEHFDVVEEMKRRSLKHNKYEVTETISSLKGLLDGFEEDVDLINNFMSLVGSTVKHAPGHEPNDIDIHVRAKLDENSYLRRAIEVRLLKMLRPEIANKIHFIFGDEQGSHDTFVPLYHLSLRKATPVVVNMADTTTESNPDICGKAIARVVSKRTGRIGEVREKRIKVVHFDDDDEDDDYYFDDDEFELVEVLNVSLFHPFKPMKPSGILNKTLFYDMDKLFEKVIPSVENPIFVEEKYDGFRAVVHKRNNTVKIYSDQENDITSAFPSIVNSIKSLTSYDAIFDGELVVYDESGMSLGRRGLMEYIGAVKSGKEIDDSRVKYHIFDIVYFDKPVNDLKLYERKKILASLTWPKSGNVLNVPFIVCTDKNELEHAVSAVSKIKESEGAMLKFYNSRYIAGNISNEWIKFRKVSDVYVTVLEKIPVKGTNNAWRYKCGFEISKEEAERIVPEYVEKLDGKYYHVFGNTFNTSINANVGDVLNVIVQEIWRHKSKDGIRYSWHKPNVRSLAEKGKRSTMADVDNIVVSRGIEVVENVDVSEDETRSEVASAFWKENWFRSYPHDGKGEFVYHHHWRGLSKEESTKDENYLFTTNHSIHGDLRFKFNENTLFGFTVFLGRSADNREKDRLESGEDVQGSWKLYQPAAWLAVGKDSPYVSEPSDVGATSKKYAKFFMEDSGTYEIGVWREHFFELFLHGKKLNGRYIINYVPIGGKRVWVIHKPEDQTPYAEKNDMSDVVNELRSKGQKYLIWSAPGKKPRLMSINETTLA